MESDSSEQSEGYVPSEGSVEVEDFSPPSSPDVDIEEGGVEEPSGPQPYQFEPLAHELAGAAGVAEADEAAEPDAHYRMGPVSEWCSCSHCICLSPRENICCREVPKVMRRCQQVGVATCITEHPGFEPVALNPYSLQVAYAVYLQLYGESMETMVNSCYRHLAYRNFVRWCWGYLGEHIRVVIPSCAVDRIRREFPEDGEYTGFLPPPDFSLP